MGHSRGFDPVKENIDLTKMMRGSKRHDVQAINGSSLNNSDVTFHMGNNIYYLDKVSKDDVSPISEEQPSAIQKAIRQNLEKYYADHYQYLETLFRDKVRIEKSYINLAIIQAKTQQTRESELLSLQQLEQAVEEKAAQFRETLLQTYESIYQMKSKPIRPEDLFERTQHLHIQEAEHDIEPEKETTKLLILGRAGIGKTTVCQYIVDRWRSGNLWANKFQAIFWLKLRDLKPDDESKGNLSHILWTFYFGRSLDITPDDIEDYLRYYKDEILFLLDGYDEVSTIVCDGTSCLSKILQQIWTYKYVLMTSRPCQVDKIGHLPISFDQTLENIGFLTKDVSKYIYEYFDEDPNAADTHSRKILEFLRPNLTLLGIAHIPIMLEIICFNYPKESFDRSMRQRLPKTMTELYADISETLLKRYLEKRKERCSTDLVGSNRANQKHIIACGLELLAFHAMSSKQIIIPAKQKRNLERYYNELPWLEILTYSGFVKSRSIGGNNAAEEYYFLHLTFQEFFAARFIKRWIMEQYFEIGRKLYNQPYDLLQTFCSESEDIEGLEEFISTGECRGKRYLNFRGKTYSSKEALIRSEVLGNIKEARQIVDWCVRIKKAMQFGEEIYTHPKDFITQYRYDNRYEMVWWFVAGLLSQQHIIFRDYFGWLLCSAESIKQPIFSSYQNNFDDFTGCDIRIESISQYENLSDRIVLCSSTHCETEQRIIIIICENQKDCVIIHKKQAETNNRTAPDVYQFGDIDLPMRKTIKIKNKITDVTLHADQLRLFPVINNCENIAIKKTFLLFLKKSNISKYQRKLHAFHLKHLLAIRCLDESRNINLLRDPHCNRDQSPRIWLEKLQAYCMALCRQMPLHVSATQFRVNMLNCCKCSQYMLGQLDLINELIREYNQLIKDQNRLTMPSAILAALGTLGQDGRDKRIIDFLFAQLHGESANRYVAMAALYGMGIFNDQLIEKFRQTLINSSDGREKHMALIFLHNYLTDAEMPNEKPNNFMSELRLTGESVRKSNFASRTVPASATASEIGITTERNDCIQLLSFALGDTDPDIQNFAYDQLKNYEDNIIDILSNQIFQPGLYPNYTKQVITGLCNLLRREKIYSEQLLVTSVFLQDMSLYRIIPMLVEIFNAGNIGALKLLIDGYSYPGTFATFTLEYLQKNHFNESVVLFFRNALRAIDENIKYGVLELVQRVRVKDVETIRILLELLIDEPKREKHRIIDILVEFNAIIIELTSIDPGLQNKVIESLITAFEDKNEDIRKNAVWALGQLFTSLAVNSQRKVVEVLTTALRDDINGVRIEAAQVLAQLYAFINVDLRRELIEVLTTALRSQDSDICARAAQVLVQLHTSLELGVQREIIGAITIALEDDVKSHVRTIVTWVLVLGQLCTSLGINLQCKVIEALTTALRDRDNDVRQKAVKVLAQLYTSLGIDLQRKVIKALMTALRGGSRRVRQAAVKALAQFYPSLEVDLQRNVIEALTTVLRDGSGLVRREAAKALTQLGTSSEVDLQRKVIAVLTTALCDGSGLGRLEAAKALTQLGTSSEVDLQRNVIEALTTVLRDGSGLGRLEAAKALTQLGTSSEVDLQRKVIAVLTTALCDGSGLVRLEAVKALAQLYPSLEVDLQRKVLKALTTALRDRDNDVKQKAVQVLAQFYASLGIHLQREMIEALTTALCDGSGLGRLEAAKVFTQLGTSSEVDLQRKVIAVLTTALCDGSGLGRLEAVKALAQLYPSLEVDLQHKVIAVLTTALRDDSWFVRQKVGKALAQFYASLGIHLQREMIEALTTALRDGSWLVKRDAAKALTQLGTSSEVDLQRKVIAVLTTALRDDSWLVRQKAGKALAQLYASLEIDLQRKVIEALTTALRDGSWLVRRDAVKALAQLYASLEIDLQRKVIAVLTTALCDGSEFDRLEAVKALAQLYASLEIDLQRKVIEALTTALRDRDNDVRQKAVKVLAQLYASLGIDLQRKVIEALTTALRDGSEFDRLEAVKALAQLYASLEIDLQRKVIEALTTALRDRDNDVRQKAVKVLAQLYASLGIHLQRKVIEALTTALRDGSWLVRRDAAKALTQLGTSSEVDLQRKVIEVLTTALRDRNHYVAQEEVQVLAQFYPSLEIDLQRKVIKALMTALRDRNHYVGQKAVQVLAQFYPSLEIDLQRKVIKALMTALRDRDNDVKQKAVKVLAQLYASLEIDLQRKVIKALMTALRDGDNNVRQKAVTALIQLFASLSVDLQRTMIKDLIRTLDNHEGDIRRKVTLAIFRAYEAMRVFTPSGEQISNLDVMIMAQQDMEEEEIEGETDSHREETHTAQLNFFRPAHQENQQALGSKEHDSGGPTNSRTGQGN